MVGTWNFSHLWWYQAGPLYHDYNALSPHELWIYGKLKIFALFADRAHGCPLKSCVTSNTWYAEICGWTRDVLRILTESWDWLMR